MHSELTMRGQKFYSFMLCCNGILFWRKHEAKCVCSGIVNKVVNMFHALIFSLGYVLTNFES